ncbi:MAG: tRNA epoxyqueuosine(34) reductase QueG [Gammaproteobacteria bacterium]|nr:tRNA epoxyqueuosine(34) reductase QueG [Gammaproteobacteria bacterium]
MNTGSGGSLSQTARALDLEKLSRLIKAWGGELGFQQIGITDMDLSTHESHVRDWLDKQFNGEMGYLERNLDKRLHPELLLNQSFESSDSSTLKQNSWRVIAARMDYLATDTQPLKILNDNSKGYVSRYALGRDYHKVVRRRLVKLAKRINREVADLDVRYRAFTDSAPVLEKALAEKAGLGWIGKHSLLLNRNAGSWFFLGEIFTNLPLPVDAPSTVDHCGNCKACINVCPTNAIVGPKQLDARRCISYLTIELKGAIPEPLRGPVGNRIFGCDDCQLFCPWNRYARHTEEGDFTPRHNLDGSDLLTLFEWTEAEFLRKTEGSAIRRINYQQWQRNLAVALGNGEPTEPVLTALRKRLDPSFKTEAVSEMVREHITWALRTLEGRLNPDG